MKPALCDEPLDLTMLLATLLRIKRNGGLGKQVVGTPQHSVAKADK